MREHEHTPLYEVQRWGAQPGRALFDSVLLFQNFPVDQSLLAVRQAEGLRFDKAEAADANHYPITLIVDQAESLNLTFSYQRAHFSEAQVQRLGEQLWALLRDISEHPNRRLGSLELATGRRAPAAARRTLTRRAASSRAGWRPGSRTG